MISLIKDGRASVVPNGEPDELIPCQTLIIAIGQNIETKHFEESGIPVKRAGSIHSLTAASGISPEYLQEETVHPVPLPS